jgi:long-chain acyl-CoA synthetase
MPIASVYLDDPIVQPLIGPGAPFEVQEIVLDGVPLRDFVRAPRTLVDIFRMGVAHEDLVHIVHGDERVTFGEVRRRAWSLARELQSTLGVRAGDRVAIAMRNLPEFVVSFWGAALVGAIIVPLNSWWTGEELVYGLRDAGAVVAFLDPERLERVRVYGAPAGVHLVAVRTRDCELCFDDLVTGAAIDESAIADLGPDDLVTILYTSGTTGRPKGAPATNRAHIANLWNMAFAAARESLLARRPAASAGQSATLSAQPLFHIGGIASIIGGPMGGGKLVMMPRWDLQSAVALAQREGLTNLGGVPTIARQLLDHPGIGKLGLDVRSFPMGGAAVPPDLPLRAIEVFGPGVQILNGYGLTETTSACATNVGIEFEARPDSVGRTNLTADVRIVDPDGSPLPPGEVGEICFRSPQVARGYWNNEEATAEVFRDGWFHSGDVGTLDDEGFLYVVDRMKDVVIRGGENVYSPEVEAVLYEHPDVAEVVVIGLPEALMGERVCAVVVPRPGATPDLASLRAFVAAHLAAFKCPEALFITDELPKTATSKVAKRELRVQLTEREADLERLW